MNYKEFLASKRICAKESGFEAESMSEALFPFQRDIVRWTLRRGRAAIFADTGLGKTAMQLEWARHVVEKTGGKVLILAPLAVSRQTAKEGEKFGIGATVCRGASDLREGVNITNYERLHHFDSSEFAGIALDESSILKSFDGKTRRNLTNFAASIHYRLACTATPAPNDIDELANHAEFLGVMSGKEMLALFFVQDGNTTHKWRLKRHATEDFWAWVSSWAFAIRKPSEIGYEDGAYNLPPLTVEQVSVGSVAISEGRLFGVEAQTLMERRKARRESLEDRVNAVIEIVAQEPDEQWLLWCDLNAESEALRRAIPGAVEVRGSDSPEHKEKSLLGFAAGEIEVLVSKPSIAGHGMNFQSCARMAFVGLSDSFEQLFQATRRCWRYGQTREVKSYIVTSEQEGAVVANINRKEKQASEMMDQLVASVGSEVYRPDEYDQDETGGEEWSLYRGDCVERIQEVANESVGLTVTSIPFASMYAYTDSSRDVGNIRDLDELVNHLSYLIPELYRVTRPGRNCVIHVTQAVAFKATDGFSGLIDQRGRVIQAMVDAGWIYYGEVTIEKNPQVKAVRTKDHGLMFKSLANDASKMHMAMADYLLQFKKPGDNDAPIRAGISEKYQTPGGWITNEEWINWASPVWWMASKDRPGGIRETNVLNVSAARTEKDERHLCPLQLDVIERCIKLWSNPDDLILDPFNGIGSTGHVALAQRRRYLGIELKDTYYQQSARVLRTAEANAQNGTLFEATS